MPTAFDRARLRIMQPAPQPETPSKLLTPQAAPTSVGQSLIDGFSVGNLTADAVRALQTANEQAAIAPDPNFKLGDTLKDEFPWLLELSYHDDTVASNLSELRSADEV